jgi:hypothetical protein
LFALKVSNLTWTKKMPDERCPACKRIENDYTLAFCRGDGAPLVNDLVQLARTLVQ